MHDRYYFFREKGTVEFFRKQRLKFADDHW